MIYVSEEDLSDGTNGACLYCGEIHYGGIEPDARKYHCDNCGEMEVYGLEELLLMERISILEDEEREI